MKHLLVAIITVLSAARAHAVIRPIVIPGKIATIMLQAVDATTGGTLDPEPRALYDAIAMPAVQSQGGEGKVIGTAEKDFNLTCAYKSQVSALNVLCTIVVKPSARTKVMFNEVEFSDEGAEAADFYQKFAGPHATQPFVWQSKNGWLKIESYPDRFHFHFKN